MEGSGLGINGKLILAQTINFLIFLFLFRKFIAPSFFKFIDKEKKDEEERKKTYDELEKQKQKQQELLDNALKDAKIQAKNIISEAEISAKTHREKLIQDATSDAHEIREKAKKQIEAEKVKMLSDIRSHIIVTSKSLVKAVLKDVIGKKEQSSIIETVVKKLSNEKTV